MTWDPELVELFGLTGEPLPDIVGSDEVVGTTDIFGPTLPVAGLIVDQQAALLAESCLEPGSAKCTYGTGAFLLAQLGGEPVRSTSGLTTSVAWRLRDQTSYCADGQVYTAASAVRWAVDLGLVPAADQIDSAAADSSDGVVCVPALAGLAAPWWDSAATASFSGMTLSSGRGNLVRALLEGVAAQVTALTDLVSTDLGTPLTRLRVDGGLTRSRGADAGAGRPIADPRGRVPVAARHRAGSGSVRAARAGTGSHRRGHGGHLDPAAYLPAALVRRARRGVPGPLATRRGNRSCPNGFTEEDGPMISDVVVVGAGIVGCAIARALAGTQLSVTLVEARNDVGDGTSKANTALLHTGFDATPGTLESRLVARGYDMLGEYAEQTGIPVERTGAMLVAWTEEESDALPVLMVKAERNGYHRCGIVRTEEIYRRVPDLGPGRWPDWTSPASRSSARGPPTWRWRPTPSRVGCGCCAEPG